MLLVVPSDLVRSRGKMMLNQWKDKVPATFGLQHVQLPVPHDVHFVQNAVMKSFDSQLISTKTMTLLPSDLNVLLQYHPEEKYEVVMCLDLVRQSFVSLQLQEVLVLVADVVVRLLYQLV